MTTAQLDPPSRRATPGPTSSSPTSSASPTSPTFPTRIVIYAGVVLGLGWLGPLIDHTTGHGLGEGPGQLLWILLPVAAAMVLRWKGGDGFGDAGLRLRGRQSRSWYLLSGSFYPIVMVTAATGGLLAGHWDLHDDWAPLRFAAIAGVALVPFTLTAIAEEFGWRGYLTPRLDAAGVGRLTNHLIVGVIWGLWHLPYMTVAWDFTSESRWTLALRVIGGTTVAAVIYGEIRLRTGTVWPAVTMHAASNAVAAGLLDNNVLTQNDPTPWLFSPGIDGVVVFAITGLVAALFVMRQQNSNRPAAPATSPFHRPPPADPNPLTPTRSKDLT